MSESKKKELMRCPICFNNIYMGTSHRIHNTLYKKSSQTTSVNRLHQGKPAHSKYKKTLALPCSHLFHKECIKKWFKCNPTCPLCRK